MYFIIVSNQKYISIVNEKFVNKYKTNIYRVTTYQI